MNTLEVQTQVVQDDASLPSSVSPTLRNKKHINNKKYQMRVEGHRGAGYMEPENSIKAFRRAIELGLDGVELDVWLTQDNVPVVVHGLEGGVVEFVNNFKEVIGKIDSTDLHLDIYTLKNGEKIPTLAAVLDACLDGVCINIEIKEKREEVMGKVLDLLQERDMLHQINFSSFNHFLRQTLSQEVERRKIDIHVPFGFLIAMKKPIAPETEFKMPEFPDFDHFIAGDSFNLDIRYLEWHREECLEKIALVRAKKVGIFFWFPMDYTHEDTFYDDLSALQIDTICTNKPTTIVEYLTQRALTQQQLGV